MFSKRHFEFIAKVLSDTRTEAANMGAKPHDFEVLDQVVNDFNTAFSTYCPRFNPSTFLRKAGYGKRGM